jgi:GT2 family glycosyltransferase
MSDGTAITALLPLKHFHAPFLREAMESMFRQTSPLWRLLVIVEPEDLAAFRMTLAEWLADPRVRLVPNEGYRHAGAFNTGMRVAETEFVAILLGDDRWDPRAVEVLMDAIRAHPGVDLFHSSRRAIDGDGRPLSDVMPALQEVSLEGFIWKSQVKHLICWRRSKGLAVGGMDETLTTAGPDDYDFPWTMLEHGAVIRAIPECLYIYRDHREGVRNTTHYPRSVHLRDLRHILTKHGVSRSQVRRRLRMAKRGYLRQCLYRNELHRRLATWLGSLARRGWRLTYR